MNNWLLCFADCSEILGLGSSGDTNRDKLIRTGEMTPFGTVVKQEPTEEQPSVAIPAEKHKITNEAENSEGVTESVQEGSRNEFGDDDLYDPEIEEVAGSHSDRDGEWLPSDGEKSSDAELPVHVKEERKCMYV